MRFFLLGVVPRTDHQHVKASFWHILPILIHYFDTVFDHSCPFYAILRFHQVERSGYVVSALYKVVDIQQRQEGGAALPNVKLESVR